jgi:hypothetical protein
VTDSFDNFTVDKVVLLPKKNSQLYDCVREAVLFAFNEKKSACFVFAGRRYEVTPNDIVEEIIRKGKGE